MDANEMNDRMEEEGVSPVDLYWVMARKGLVDDQVLIDTIESYALDDGLIEELSNNIHEEEDLIFAEEMAQKAFNGKQSTCTSKTKNQRLLQKLHFLMALRRFFASNSFNPSPLIIVTVFPPFPPRVR